MAAIGSVAEVLVLSGIGMILDAQRLKRILSGRIGRIFHLKPQGVERVQGWFLRKGDGFRVFLTVYSDRAMPHFNSHRNDKDKHRRYPSTDHTRYRHLEYGFGLAWSVRGGRLGKHCW